MNELIDKVIGVKRIAYHELWADREIRFDCAKKELEMRPGEQILELIVRGQARRSALD